MIIGQALMRTISDPGNNADDDARLQANAFTLGMSSSHSYPELCTACGSAYMPDALYCRKCGLKREDVEVSRADHTPIWSWSRDGPTPSNWWRKRKKPTSAFRFIDRDSPLGQSMGTWNISRTASKHTKDIRKLYWQDTYHTFIDGSSTTAQLAVYAIVYTVMFLVFGVFYLLISEQCGLGIEGKFVRAYYLSLETMVTIGYGAPDQYYNDCWEGKLILTAQSLAGYFINALVIGSVFLRLTRPQCRANTILFSEKACIQEVDGALYLVFQVCEAQSHDLVQAHVRCYCIRHERKGDQAYQTIPLRLQQPDDDHGSTLLLNFPTKIIHRIDNWSPLSPAADSVRRTRKASRDARQATPKDVQSSAWAYHWPEVPQRQVDADQGNRDTCVCAVCGSSFQSFELLRRHTEYNASQDPLNGVPKALCHKAWMTEDMRHWGWSLVEQMSRPGAIPESQSHAVASTEPTKEDVQGFIAERFVEVVVFVEGIEPSTSASLQARHSYLFPNDLVWDRDFAPCALRGETGELCAVDLSRFNDLVPFSDLDGPDAFMEGFPEVFPSQSQATFLNPVPPALAPPSLPTTTTSTSPPMPSPPLLSTPIDGMRPIQSTASTTRSRTNRLVDIVTLGNAAVQEVVQMTMSPKVSETIELHKVDAPKSTLKKEDERKNNFLRL
mmetsp:Transcript_59924/g.126856  ORF Transcript_59924/g.126856 Transcript_59924/m.126856 type:complete len:669 (+) Transcript_59924:186-2192(+)|eukprot:CAMPEP_0206457228 /NCGR_PEP_ID=MMETSP0324_2-20121206/22837_1 /ASSEMBLY_ACC=CAM_ASM_000836 /TAXON_ID=2866 /ORGANISM="Crypthecodinium cohnii, Strain Seligo" /LENGTH=668 /DNA_ID=CAMNT_0053928311 /DNA_START=99 /DNA_END=2105 /DNA_ORIENTATION=-